MTMSILKALRVVEAMQLGIEKETDDSNDSQLTGCLYSRPARTMKAYRPSPGELKGRPPEAPSAVVVALSDDPP